MPYVHVHWFEGRSEEQKAEVARRITDAIVEVGKAKREEVWIRFDDSKREDWTFGGERKS
jgi:4-oxalocrotonate tautomerase